MIPQRAALTAQSWCKATQTAAGALPTSSGVKGWEAPPTELSDQEGLQGSSGKCQQGGEHRLGKRRLLLEYRTTARSLC